MPGNIERYIQRILMRFPGDDLGTRLTTQREERAYRRRRAVRQFSHRMRAAGLIGAIFILLLVLVLSLLRWRVDLPQFQVAARVLFVIGWLYLALFPLLFAFRTHLIAYLLQEHWIWLSAWLVLPVDYFVIRFGIGAWQWIPIFFFGLLLLGRGLSDWRNQRFLTELEANQSLWERLTPLGVLDLLLLGFWNSQRDQPT